MHADAGRAATATAGQKVLGDSFVAIRPVYHGTHNITRRTGEASGGPRQQDEIVPFSHKNLQDFTASCKTNSPVPNPFSYAQAEVFADPAYLNQKGLACLRERSRIPSCFPSPSGSSWAAAAV